jgi:hypothetical protein
MMNDDNEMTTTTSATITAAIAPLSSLPTRTIHNENCRNNNDRSLILFSPALCHSIVAQHRLAPVYIGIPPVRPETDILSTNTTTSTAKDKSTSSNIATIAKSKQGAKAHTQQQLQPSVVVYKVFNPDGTERRMTAQEKKLAKLQHKSQLKQQQQQQQSNQQQHTSSDEMVESKGMLQPSHENSSSNNVSEVINHNGQSDDRYVPIHRMDDTLLESEENGTDRDGIPPVMLPPPLAQFIRPITTRTPSDATMATRPIEMDMKLSELWGRSLLQHSIWPAQCERQKETNIRSMPYHIVPEVWTRLRPKFYTRMNDTENNHIHNNVNNRDDNDSCNDYHSQDHMWCNMNATNDATFVNGHYNRDDKYEDDVIRNRNTILQFLHHPNHEPQLHISDGTKFGCDFLLYDGPRHERHAFAGLRIVPPAQSQHDGCATTTTLPTNNKTTSNSNNTIENDSDHARFPIHPNAYDLAGYVRCLNTAGKLALLATSVLVNDTEPNNHIDVSDNTTQQQQQGRLISRKVLIVDLALEKVAMTTSRRPKKTMEQRLKNLSKSTNQTK